MPYIIFDCDNTLFETLPFHWQKHVVALERAGIKAKPEWQDYIYGHNGRQNWTWLASEHGLTTPLQDYLREIDEWYFARLGMIPLREGIEEVMALASIHSIPMAVASIGRRTSVERILRAHGIYERFDTIVTGDDVTHTKPHPELYRTALTKLAANTNDIDPKDVLVIEDDPAGVTSARAAGLPTIIHRRLSPTQAWAEEATYQVDRGEELVAVVRRWLAA